MFGRRWIRSWKAQPEVLLSMILAVSIAPCRTGAQRGIPRVAIPVLVSQLTANIIMGMAVAFSLVSG